jgi:hypothetical protein
MNWTEYVRRGETHVGWRVYREGVMAVVKFDDGSGMAVPASMYDRAWMRVWIFDSSAPEAWNPESLAEEVRRQIAVVNRPIAGRGPVDRAGAGTRLSSLGYICAECGGVGYADADSIDSGTTFTHDECGGKTVVTLSTPSQMVTSTASRQEE